MVITGVTNPSSSPSQYFLLIAYASDGNVVGISSSGLSRFAIICTYPCRTCAVADPAQCLSCYSAPLELHYTLLHASQCVDHCHAGYYSTGSSCLTCNSNCLTCLQADSTHCLTCPANQYLLSTQCYSSCPPGFYPTIPAYMCAACPSNCATCSSLTVCASCSTGYYLHVGYGLCLPACPPATFQLATPLRCVDCLDANCL